jgi:hypothetical protein
MFENKLFGIWFWQFSHLSWIFWEALKKILKHRSPQDLRVPPALVAK